MNICQPKPVPLPDDALLWRYRGKQGHYTDCYACTVEGPVEFGTFVFSFYTTWLFRCERLILKLLVKRPSTDHDASSLASGASKTFAAWTVEARSTDEILMCDMAGRTRSWLKVEQLDNNKALDAIKEAEVRRDLAMSFQRYDGMESDQLEPVPERIPPLIYKFVIRKGRCSSRWSYHACLRQ